MRNETLRKILTRKLSKLEEKISPTLLEIELVKQQLELLDKHEAAQADRQAERAGL